MADPTTLTDPGEWLKQQSTKSLTDPGAWLSANPDALKGAGIRFPGTPDPDQPNAGERVLKYATDTISNIPGSAVNLLGNAANAVIHPVDTGSALLHVATGIFQKMTPDTPSHANQGDVPYADAALDALKKRYGSLDAAAESFRNDPAGVLADISALAGGVSGAAKLTSAGARVANMGRVASVAGDIADTARVVSDVTNPLTLPLKAVAYPIKAVAKGLVRTALPGLGGRAERYGATPATAVLEQTSGLTPTAIRESALARIDELNKQLDAVTDQASAAGITPSLQAAKDLIVKKINAFQAANDTADDLLPMYKFLTEIRPGFAGNQGPVAGLVDALQDPKVFLAMKRRFGKRFTKFDAAVPLSSEVRGIGNDVYHELSTEFNQKVPGAQPINRDLQSMSPIPSAAQRADESAGTTERIAFRAARPTGGLAAAIYGMKRGGVLGGVGTIVGQEALASPTVRMGLARTAYGTGKAIASPVAARTITSLGAITPDAAMKFYDASGGDIAKARQMAVDAGWELK